MVTPFVAPLRKWIKKFKKARQQGTARKHAALKVIMDQVENDSEDETEDNGYESNGDHVNEYVSTVPEDQQVPLEDSLKKLLGLTVNNHAEEWDYANQLSHSLPDPHRMQPIPFGTVPGMELPSMYSQEQYNPAHIPLVQPIPSTEYSNEESKQKNQLLDILVGKPEGKQERKKKKGYGDVNIMTKETSTPRSASPPKKEMVPIVQESLKPPTPAINTEGLLKLLVQSQSPRASDPGLEQLLSGKKIDKTSPLHPEKQSLEDILRGAPPLPVQRQSRSTVEERLASPRISNSSPKSQSSMLQDLLLHGNRFEKPSFSTSVSEQTMNAKPTLDRSFTAPNPFAGSLLDILVPPKVVTPKEKKSDLLNILLNK
jgi:hypothetical protein